MRSGRSWWAEASVTIMLAVCHFVVVYRLDLGEQLVALRNVSIEPLLQPFDRIVGQLQLTCKIVFEALEGGGALLMERWA